MTARLRFDADRTGWATEFLDQNHDKVAFLEQPVMPPVGTRVELPAGRGTGEVSSVLLDLSNESGLAMVYVGLVVRNTSEGRSTGDPS